MTDRDQLPEDSTFAKSIDFAVSQNERRVAGVIPSQKGAPVWPAVNALRHLNKAWALRTADLEMFIFRCITAEEEAAAAVIRSLRRRRYDGAKRVNPKDHLHKNAIIPFWDAVTRVFAKIRQPPPLQMYWDFDYVPPRLRIRIRTLHPSTGDEVWASPQPPLDFSHRRSRDGGATYEVEDFTAGFVETAAHVRMPSIEEHLRDRASQRNRLLYAREDGLMKFSGDADAIFASAKRNVFMLLRMYLFIDPWGKRQSFVQQALSSFVRLLDRTRGRIEFE